MEQWLSSINTKCAMPYTPDEIYSFVVDENDIGTPDARLRSTAPRIFHTMDMKFTQDEWKRLKQWVRFNLAGGIQPFIFPHPETKEPTTMRFTIEDGNWYSSLRWRNDYVFITLKMEELPNG